MLKLTTDEANQTELDMTAIIESTGDLAEIIRPIKTDEDDVFGGVEASEGSIATDIPIELQDIDPRDLIQEDHDRIAHVLSGIDIQENDFLIINGNIDIRYRITDIIQHNLFGTLTHCELKLSRKYQDNP